MTKATLTAVLTVGLLLLPGQATTQQPAAPEHGTHSAAAQATPAEQHCDMMKPGATTKQRDTMKCCDTVKCGEMMKHGDMTRRGEQAMGFSQEKTTHHFYLAKDGGVIDVVANDAKDTASREEIRQHLTHIAHLFADGNFDAPMFIHATTPPGVPTMTRLHEQIHYEFQQTESGGRVRITTSNAQALDATHAFLLFQIVDHQTGDSAAIAETAEKK